MASILYCGVCTMPPEYCRYHPKYDKCLAWMKNNQPKLFVTEIQDISKRNPKIAKKARYLWDANAPQPEEKKNEFKQTKKVKILEKKIEIEQKISNDQISDITSKIAKLSTNKNNSPSKSILKKRKNPNYKMEKEKLESIENSDGEIDRNVNEFGLGVAGNRNKRSGPPARKDTKKRKRNKKNNRDRGRNRNKNNENESENKENEMEEEEEKKRVKFYEKYKNKKIPKNIVEVLLENRKGNKKVTVVRGYVEKTKFKESEIQSAFRKKFATSVQITFQNPGSEKGPKQVVLMGDKRHDFMRYLKEKFPKVGDLLYYKSKRYGLTPAVDPQHGFIMPPPR